MTPPAPQASTNVILALPSFDNVLPLFQTVKRQLSEILSAFEFIDRTAYDLAVKHGQGRALSDDETEGAECFVLVETSGGNRDHDEEVSSCFIVRHLSMPDVFAETQHSPRGSFDRRQTLDQHGCTIPVSGSVLVYMGSTGGCYRGCVKGRQSLQVRHFYSAFILQESCRSNARASSLKGPDARQSSEVCSRLRPRWRWSVEEPHHTCLILTTSVHRQLAP